MNLVVQKYLMAMTAILSLSVTPIFACACSHHEQETAAITPSCNGSMHEHVTLDAVGQATGAAHFQTGCVCFLQAQTPSATNKPETKKFKHAAVEIASKLDRFGLEPARSYEADLVEDQLSPTLFIVRLPLADLAPRAPPRL